ncbi:MAG: DUF3299 domain-containing protein [Halioglobus sp.]|nr:DUF3299 domain-containing protein [Halioglobus sp.]
MRMRLSKALQGYILGTLVVCMGSIADDTPQSTGRVQTIEWTDLIPEEDLEALLNPPDYIDEIEDGSIEDQISSEVKNTIAAASDDRYQQALVSTRVKNALDNRVVRIPGFIVPLEFSDDQNVTQFFLVPYFGACLHVPPPPPNQIILVNYPQGLQLGALYDPFWITGKLSTTITENEVATSAYSIQMDDYQPYSIEP